MDRHTDVRTYFVSNTTDKMLGVKKLEFYSNCEYIYFLNRLIKK